MASPHKHVNPIPDWAESAPVDWVLRNAARDGLVEVVQNQLRLGCKVDSPDVVRKPTALAPHAQRCCAAGERPGLTLAGCGVPLSERPHCAAARKSHLLYRQTRQIGIAVSVLSVCWFLYVRGGRVSLRTLNGFGELLTDYMYLLSSRWSK